MFCRLFFLMLSLPLVLSFLDESIGLIFCAKCSCFKYSLYVSILAMMLIGMLGVSCSNPPCTYTFESTAQHACLNLCSELNLYHSLDSVSYTSKGTISPT